MQIRTETKVGIFVIIAITIFIFMTLGIGAFRFGTSGYSPYKVSFSDVSGLSRKADVKIAGVKVGWVEDVELSDAGKAQANIMVNKKYALYDNAYAVVRQEGLIGTKYLEVSPGDPMLPKLASGEQLARPGREAVSVDELLFKFKTIAGHVEQFTASLKDALGGDDKSAQIRTTIENISNASAKIEKLATSLEHVITGNEDSINTILHNIQNITENLKTDLPAMKDSFNKFAADTTDSLSNAAHEARETFENLSSVTQKINDGRGLLGKLINEEEMYKDIKSTVSGIKNYLNKFDTVGVIIDSHSETLNRPVDAFKFTDTKGYLNVRLHTNDNFFYMGQIATAAKGFVNRDYIYQTFYDSRDDDYHEIAYEEIPVQSPDIIAQAINDSNRREFSPFKIIQRRLQYAYGLQVGMIYGNLSLRAGLFEGTFGAGADYYIPLQGGKLAWITTLEIFDMKGLQRLEINKQRRPHLKWLNKIFVCNNLYTTMGADDFISHNATMFWGFGVRFADDDLKYLISKVGFAMPSS